MEYAECGRIIKPQGIKGEVKLKIYAGGGQVMEKAKTLYIKKSGGYESYDILSLRISDGFAYIMLKGVCGRNAAEELRDCEVFIHKKQTVKLPKNTYYVSDIIDMKVFDEEGQELGTIKEVTATGGVDVYTVKGEKIFSFPALNIVIKNIDVKNKVMTIYKERLLEVAVYEV